MNCHLSTLISKWIWIFSSTSILSAFLAMIASSWFLVAIPFNFQTHKLIQKWAAKMFQLKMHSMILQSNCVNFRKKSCILIWSIFQWQLMISEFMTPKIYLIYRFLSNFSIISTSQSSQLVRQWASQSTNQSVSDCQSIILSVIQSVSQSVSNWTRQPVNWSEVLKEVSLYLKQQVSQAISQSYNQSVSQSVRWSMNQVHVSKPAGQSVSMSISQLFSQQVHVHCMQISQSINQSAD